MNAPKYRVNLKEMPVTNASDVLGSLGLRNVILGDCIIAGGAIRDLNNAPIKDIDIFGTYEARLQFLRDNKEVIQLNNISPLGHMNVSIKGCPHPVQFIVTKCATDVSTLLLDFDIEVCRFAHDKTGTYGTILGISDRVNKIVRISAFHTPFLTATRLTKYLDRGYKLENPSYRVLLSYLFKMDEAQYEKEFKALETCLYEGAFEG